MKVPANALVFDTGPLRHFAMQGWLGVLRYLAEDRPVFIPDSVERELNRTIEYASPVRAVLDADWINVHRSNDLSYVEAFARYADRLAVGGWRLAVGDKNIGECGVLAMGHVYGCEVVLDDATPRRIAEEVGIRATATISLLCKGIRMKRLTIDMVECLADHLLEGEYYLPFRRGEFRQHVLENGLIDYDEI
ncbi:hypothetical protein GCM10009834_29810 [Streptomonospora arabica]